MTDSTSTPFPAAASAPGDPLFERHVPFLELLGVRPISAQRGRAVFELTVEPRHLRTLGLLHGGVTATLLDTSMGYAAGTTAPENHYVVTAQLNLHFTRAANEGDVLTSTGEVLHAGSRTAVVQGDIRTADGKLVATGTATFLFLPRPT